MKATLALWRFTA